MRLRLGYEIEQQSVARRCHVDHEVDAHLRIDAAAANVVVEPEVHHAVGGDELVRVVGVP